MNFTCKRAQSDTDHSAGVIRYDEVGLDVVVLDVSVPQPSVPRLHFVVIAEASQRLAGNVDAAGGFHQREK